MHLGSSTHIWRLLYPNPEVSPMHAYFWYRLYWAGVHQWCWRGRG